MAKAVIERVPSVEMVRFVNSGTEACLSVLRLMRAYTGREKVGAAICRVLMINSGFRVLIYRDRGGTQACAWGEKAQNNSCPVYGCAVAQQQEWHRMLSKVLAASSCLPSKCLFSFRSPSLASAREVSDCPAEDSRPPGLPSLLPSALQLMDPPG